jgi:hypothetical protein
MTPEQKAAQRERRRLRKQERMADPAYRERVNAMARDKWRERMADPEFRKKVNAQITAWRRARKASDPLYREQQREYRRVQTRRLRTDPDYRERVNARGRGSDVLVPAARAALLAAQGYACPLCAKALTDNDVTVDHDHATGRVRGLLHGTCNRIEGLLDKNPSFCVDRLRAYRESPPAYELLELA